MKLSKFKKPTTKWLLLGSTVILVLVGSFIGISSCSRSSYFKLALDNLSEARIYMKHAEADCCKVQFFAGMREEPYIVNGISEKKVAFGIINLDPGKRIVGDEIQGTLGMGEESIPVILERNPHGANFAMDIERLIEATQIMVLTLTIEGEVKVFNLANAMPESAINWERALEISVDTMLPQIRKAGKFECYVKIVESPVKGGGSFWYVRFVPTSGDNFFVVIDATGRVIT